MAESLFYFFRKTVMLYKLNGFRKFRPDRGKILVIDGVPIAHSVNYCLLLITARG